MFLHFLTEERERIFFMKFVYLLAVAEKEDDSENLPTPWHMEIPKEGKYEFEEFAPGFAMQISELLMLRKFSEEIGMTWAPISSRSSAQAWLDSRLVGISDISVWDSQAITSSNVIEKIAAENSVAAMITVAIKELDNTADRAPILKNVLTAMFAQAGARAFALEKRKAILMEATAMAYADGTVSDYEQELLVNFCELSNLDKELIEDFKHIAKDFSRIFSKSLELITE